MNFIIALFIFIVGTCCGSFLSVIIHRVRKKQKGIFFGRSNCVHCKKKLAAKDLIPLLSYILLKGRCRYCHKTLGPYYFFLEFITGLIFLLIYFKFSFLIEKNSLLLIDWKTLYETFLYFIYSLFFVGIFFYDLQYMEIPNLFLFPLIFVSLAGSLILGSPGLISIIIALGIALIFFGGQILLSRGQWLGEGDLYIAIAMAFIFGWQMLLVAITLMYIIGAIISIILLATKNAKSKSKIPFGPFMIMASFVTIFTGQEILNWYLKLINL